MLKTPNGCSTGSGRLGPRGLLLCRAIRKSIEVCLLFQMSAKSLYRCIRNLYALYMRNAE
jgi:hypothetical protein